ncbi:uncharacterized protein BDW70DRAFT_143913 [Aspergillus foveolatus]|uniref:uncharacterized protein n=1 Tax=Aspergillus foveolatus TaxID=210207 RepID=UPI003CCDBC0D
MWGLGLSELLMCCSRGQSHGLDPWHAIIPCVRPWLRAIFRVHGICAESVGYIVSLINIKTLWHGLLRIKKGWRCRVCVIPIRIRRPERGKQIVGTLSVMPGWKLKIAAARAPRP